MILKPSLRIAATYAVLGAVWILASDRLAAALVTDPAVLVRVNTLKGWGFVLITAALLHHLIARQLRRTAEATAARTAAEAARTHAEGQQALAREAASAAAHRLLLAGKAAHLGTWEWELAKDRLQCDEPMHLLYQVQPGQRPATFAAWTDLIHPEDRERIRKLVQATLDGRQEYHTQFRVLWPDGQVRHLESHALVLRDSAGQPLRMLGVNWDITERVRTEQRYRILAENAGDVLWIVDLGTRCYTYVSPAIFRLRGCRPEDLVGRPLEHGLSAESIALIHRLLPARLEAFLRGDPAAVTQNNELEQLRADGSTVWTEIVTTFLHNDRGGIDIVGVTRDIARRYAAEQALARSTARLAHAEEIAGIGHWTYHLDRHVFEGSANAARLCGLPPNQSCPREQIQELTLPEFRPQVSAAMHALVAEGRPYDIAYPIRRPGDGAIAHIHSRAEYDAATHTVFGTIQDITEREHTLAALRASEAKFRLLVSNAPVVLFQIGADGRFRLSEGAGLARLGLRPGEVVGRSVFDVYRDHPQIAEQIRTALAGQPVHGSTQVGDTWFEMFYNPMTDAAGTVTDIIGLAIDITERRHLHEQLLRSQRLDSVGRLAGGIAHDLNNILAPILMAPSLLRESVADPSAREILDAIETSANRGAAIIRQLLTFSRGGAGGERAPVRLAAIVRDMVAIIRETFPKNIVTRTDLPAALWLVAGDATQLHQVLMNLCVNSRDAMPAGGELTLTAENVELDAAAVAGHPDARPGPHVLLAVFDTGAGIAPEHLDKVFDPFFTTKEVGKGTGLGLATALGIVRDHHGFIHVASRPGAGTQVRVYLPAVPAAAPVPPAPETALPPRGRGELILVVDDEDNARRITRRLLEHHGYRVLVAGDGTEALALFQQHRSAVRLVLTDLIMPVMDGAALVRALHQTAPDARIIAMSGHAPAEHPLQIGTEIAAFLPKPFLRRPLLEAVAAALRHG